MARNFKRKSIIFTSVSSKPAWGASYLVNVYRPGGFVESSVTASAFIPLEVGHYFDVGDKFLKNPGSDNSYTGLTTVTAVSQSGIHMNGSFTVITGDVLVNLGPDTGVATPNYDGSPISIYEDSEGDTAIAESQVSVSSIGEYEYWHDGTAPLWELVRTSQGTPTDIITNAFDQPETQFNVRHFGAFGNGVKDDSKAIQACINAAETVNGTVYVPRGTYLLGSGLLITSGIRMYGDGMGDPITGTALDGSATAFKVTTDLTVIQIDNGAHWTRLADFAIYSTYGVSGLGHGVRLGTPSAVGNGASKCNLDRLFINGMGADGVRLSNGVLNVFNSVYTYANYGHGFNMDSEIAPTNTNANTLIGCYGSNNAGDGYHAGASKSNNVFGFNAAGNAGWGYYIDDNENTLNVYAENNTSGALKIDVSGNNNNIAITTLGNIVTLNGNNYIYHKTTPSFNPRLNTSGDFTIRGILEVTDQVADFYRITTRNGLAHNSSDYTLSAGWGTGAVASVTNNSRDQRFQVTVIANSGTSANPTVTLTFKDGAWAAAPLAVVTYNGGTGGPPSASGITWTSSTTALTMTYRGTPVSGLTYNIAGHVFG